MAITRRDSIFKKISWAQIALVDVGVIEFLFLIFRFHFDKIFPDFHYPIPLVALALLLVLLGISFYYLPVTFPLFIIAALVPCNLRSDRPHILPVSPIDYVCLAAFIATLFRFRGSIVSRIRASFGEKTLWAWGLFMLYSLVCVLVLGGSLRNTVRWIEFLGVFFLATLVPEADRHNARVRLAQLLSVLGAFCSLWALDQYVHAHFYFMDVCGPFGQHNALSGFLSLCLPASLYLSHSGDRKTIFSIFSGIIFAGIIAAFSRGAILGLLIGTVLSMLWAAKPGRRHIVASYALTALLALIALLIGFRKLRWFNGRNTYMVAGLHILKIHPWFGLGPGNYIHQIQNYLSGYSLDIFQNEMIYKHRIDFWQHLHNLYLQMAVEYGLIGFSLWFTGLFLLMRPLFLGMKQIRGSEQNLRFCIAVSVLAYLLHNMVDILFTNNLETILALFLALFYSVERISG